MLYAAAARFPLLPSTGDIIRVRGARMPCAILKKKHRPSQAVMQRSQAVIQRRSLCHSGTSAGLKSHHAEESHITQRPNGNARWRKVTSHSSHSTRRCDLNRLLVTVSKSYGALHQALPAAYPTMPPVDLMLPQVNRRTADLDARGMWPITRCRLHAHLVKKRWLTSLKQVSEAVNSRQ